jgi:hypothetical protein
VGERSSGPRRALVVIGIAVAALLVVGIGGYALVRANVPPWGEMQSALRTFPVPSG